MPLDGAFASRWRQHLLSLERNIVEKNFLGKPAQNSVIVMSVKYLTVGIEFKFLSKKIP